MRSRGRWKAWVVAVLALSAGLCGGAGAAGSMDIFHRADALFQEGRGAEACRALYSTLSGPLPPADTLAGERALLERIDRASVAYALQAARSGRRGEALQAATAGMALSRRLMERPDVTCRDVRAGIDLWRIAGEGLWFVWRELGSQERAAEAADDLQAMDRMASTVILPRCASQDAAPGLQTVGDTRRTTRSELAEARALVRLWEYSLVRIASDNLD